VISKWLKNSDLGTDNLLKYTHNPEDLNLICHRLENSKLLSLILWHVDPLLGNRHEISDYTTAVTRQRPLNSNRRMVFSVPSMPRCKQDKLGVAS
jgi:hypothetical protein